MTSFRVQHVGLDGALQFVPGFCSIIAGSREGAENMFHIYYPHEKVEHIEQSGLYQNNGYYSRYFKNKA